MCVCVCVCMHAHTVMCVCVCVCVCVCERGASRGRVGGVVGVEVGWVGGAHLRVIARF